MKVITALIVLFAITACVAGEVPEKRLKYYDSTSDTYCSENPTRCISGVPW